MDVDSSCASPSTSGNDVLEYSHIIVPPTMRSQYWQYFGFPCDRYNNIVTKKKVICTLCNTMISYNKNTTNLRTHLVAKHPNYLYALNKPKRLKSDDKIPDSSDDSKLRVPTVKSISEKEFEQFIASEEQTKINEQTAIIEALVESDIIEHDTDKRSPQNDFQAYNTSLDPQNYQVIEIEEASTPTHDAVIESITDMFIKDLLPLSIVEGVGFMNFVSTISPNIALPRKEQIERNLNNAYDVTFKMQSELIINHTNQHPFSLGIEFWTNIEQKEFVNIYVNLVSSEKDQLKNVLYKTVSTNESTNLEFFKAINLKNCTAVLVNCKTNNINELFGSHQIPVVMCFGTLIQKCLIKAFQMERVQSLVDNILHFLRNNDVNNQGETTIPILHDEFPSTKLNLISNFYDKLTSSYASWNDETNELLQKAKEIIDCLSPLKITLETIADEPVALYSLLKPLATKLMNEYFRAYNEDSETVSCIKEVVSYELSECLFDESFPSLATFFDPRFLNFIDADTLQTVKKVLNAKTKTTDKTAPSVKEEDETERRRKSSLKLFFENDDLKRNPKVTKLNSELEIQKYVNELCDMDQCPLTWWNEYGYVYRNLKTIAQNYVCVPATVNGIFKKNITQQIQYYEKLKMLKSDVEISLLYLHMNK